MQCTCHRQPLDSSAVLGWTADMTTEPMLLHESSTGSYLAMAIGHGKQLPVTCKKWCVPDALLQLA